MHVTFGVADQKRRALMCVDIILLIGVLIQNRDDTIFVHQAWVSHSDVTVWSNTRVEGEAPTRP